MYQNSNNTSIKDIIAKALIDMSQKRMFADITVSELVCYAHVSRASFYRNYHSIDDVISHIVDMIYSGLSEHADCLLLHPKDGWYKAGLNLFRYILNVKDDFFEIESENASYILYRLKKKHESKSNQIELNNTESYLFSALMGIVYAIADNWRRGGYIESPETIALLMVQMINPIIKNWDSSSHSFSQDVK